MLTKEKLEERLKSLTENLERTTREIGENRRLIEQLDANRHALAGAIELTKSLLVEFQPIQTQDEVAQQAINESIMERDE